MRMKHAYRVLFVIGLFIIAYTKVSAQVKLNGNVTIFGQINQGASYDLGYGLGLSSSGSSATPEYSMSTTPFGPGLIVGSTAIDYAPPYVIMRNSGSGMGGWSTVGTFYVYMTAYPIPSIAAVRDDIPFWGPYLNYNKFQARWVYTMIPPYKPTVYPTGTICGDKTVSLTSSRNWAILTDSYVTMTVVWEYSIGTTNTWKGIDSTRPSYYLDFTLSDKIPEIRTSKQNVRFRCRTKAQYSDRVYYSAYSEASDYIEVIPGPPRVNTALISTTKTCIGDNVGTMTLPGTGITSYYSTMRWILRPGLTPDPCDPGLGTGVSNCGDEFDWSEGTVPVSGGISISNIPKGDYSLWVLNPGVETGNCFSSYPVTIGEFDALTATENTAQHVNLSCYNSADGKIGVTAAGADPGGTYYFTLLSGSTVVRARQAGTGATMLWQNLPAGTYKVQVENSTCTRVAVVDNIVLTQPPSISGSVTSAQPTCITPGNGSITVTASATGGTVANYTFNLLKGGVSDPQSATVATNTRTFSGLAGGTYTVQVLNADKPLCTGWSSNVTLNVITPLTLQLSSRDSVSCNGGSDGRLQVSATGGSGLYRYTLGTTTNTTGLFTGLAAGTYTVKLKNQDATCNDEVSASFTIFQRPALNVVLQKTDIICNGAMNGILKAIPNGGSGSYKYGWQQLKNGVWTTSSFWFNTDQQIEGLEPGTYRVIITDDKATGCSVTSSQVTIAEPAAVQITNVSIREAVCLADGAGMTMTGTGGDGNYTYTWSLDGTNYQPFTSATKFTVAGNYQLRLTDGKGCYADAARSYTITLPATALDFTTQLSHISCKDAGDGKITVTATGGNGGPY
ncbi:SprB repeat-containing protein, partial [Chitinophaga tropicalis]